MPNKLFPKPLTRRQFLKSASAVMAGLFIPLVISSPGAIKPRAARSKRAGSGSNGPLVVNHTAVAQYQNIPQAYIDLVKCMWLNVPGESHSAAYRTGCELLQVQDSRFQVNLVESGDPEGPTDQHLRISRAVRSDYSSWQYGYGEADWYTHADAIQHTKDHLTYCNTNGLPIAALGFGWCWDMTWQNDPG